MQTNTETIKKITTVSPLLYRLAYSAFILVGIVYLVKKDFSDAVIYWGLALVFDPFDHQVTFIKRPFWQQAWLIVHLAITLALVTLMFIAK